MECPASSAARAAATAPAGAPVPGWPTSIRMMCGAPAGKARWRALAAVMTSITMKGGADAPRPIFKATLVAASRQARAARIGGGNA